MDNDDSEGYEPVPKKIKNEWSKSYSSKAVMMMKKMGHTEGEGLGKKNQGRLEPIIAFQQDGRKGLGLKVDIEKTASSDWDQTIEDISIPEQINWIANATESYNLDEMRDWITFSQKSHDISKETRFCDQDILNNILQSKSFFDKLNDSEMRRSRSRSNPFETIRSSIFLNRAAVKMANIDSMSDFMFTNPKDQWGNSLIHRNELLYFADICAGPGGFSEYILYKKSWEAKGFGFTLCGPNDFKLDKFFAGSPESFDPFYGVLGDGNIFEQSNQDSLREYIFKHTHGVHFVMADGGFSVEGQENIQEILSKQLYLCQCLTALKILRANGNFVCKLFDIFTPFSVGVIFLMYKCFDEISIIKPNTSRPANSERYLVCKRKKSNTTDVIQYLNLINAYLNDETNYNDITEIVNERILEQHTEFMEYIIDSNNLIGKNQIIGLQKIAAFCKNPYLKDTRQIEFRKKCLELWNLPDKLRQAPEVKTAETLVTEILGDWITDKEWILTAPIELQNIETIHRHINSIHDWYFVPIGRGETSINSCSLFLCKSRGNLLRFADNKRWEPVEFVFDISPKSLFYGEIVYEYSGEGRTQTRMHGIHIIDAIMLGGIDIRRLKLSERHEMCKKYSLSVNKPFKEGSSGSIRCKPLYTLKNIDNFFNDMRHYTLKDNASRLGYSFNDECKFFVPGGILLLCEIFHNYFSVISKTRNMFYYFDKTTNISYYEDNMPNNIEKTLYASFRNSFTRRLLWKWTNPMQVNPMEVKSEARDNNILYRNDIKDFVKNKQKI